MTDGALWRLIMRDTVDVSALTERESPMSTDAVVAPIRTTIPARLDRLGWSSFHTSMVAGLGAAWILDGLQITVASSVTEILTQPETLNKSLEDVTKPLTSSPDTPVAAAAAG